jgi:hypothetical protein
MLPCTIVQTDPNNPAQRLMRQLSSATQREALSVMDTATAMKTLLDAGVPRQEVRDVFSRPTGKGGRMEPISNSLMNIYISGLEFPKNIQEKVHNGIIGVSGIYALSKKPRDMWPQIVAQFEADRAAELDKERKDEEKYNQDEAKVAEAKGKAEVAAKEAEAVRAKLEAAKKEFSDKAAMVDQFSDSEANAYKEAKNRGLSEEDRKAAEERFKNAEGNTKAAVKVAEESKKAVDKLSKELEKLEGKTKSAEEQAEERRRKLEDARKLATANKKTDKKKPAASAKDIDKAAAKVGTGTLVALNATDMRKAVDQWALPGSVTVQAIFLIVQDCFRGGLTPDQAFHKMVKVTGEKKDKASKKVE